MFLSTEIEDILPNLLCYLPVKDFLSLTKTCKQLRRACDSKQLWLKIWRRDILQENLLRPTQLMPLDLLDASQTKAAVIHALRLHDTVAHPINLERSLIQSLSFPQSMPINWIRIVGEKWIVVAMSESSTSVICLWSITSLLEASSQNPRDPIAKAFLDGSVLRGLVDISNERGVVIALELRTPSSTLEVLSIRTHNDLPVFARVARHEGTSYIRDLSGPLLAFALYNDVSLPSVLNWNTGSVTNLRSRPDTDGCAVAMAVSGDNRVVLLTPKKLFLMQSSSTRDERTTYKLSAEWTTGILVGSASVIFGNNPSSAIQVCITNSRNGIEVYSIPEDSIASPQTTLRNYLVWSHQLGTENTEAVCDLIIQPLFGRTSGTVSWLESLLESSKNATMRFKTTTKQFSTRQPTSLHDATYLTLSGPDMPALYALSVRDYDDGLGLLAIGNMMGELVLYNLTGDALGKMQGALQSIAIPPLDGLEQLPTIAVPSYPPRLFVGSDVDRAACLQLCQENSLGPNGNSDVWHTDVNEDLLAEFCDSIGNLSWRLAATVHYLGKPIPLMWHICDVIFFKAGGLFFMFDPIFEPDGCVKLLPPQLTLDEIRMRLLEVGPDGFYDEAVFLPEDRSAADTLFGLGLYEQRDFRENNRDRWRELLERGGEVDPTLLRHGDDGLGGH